MQNALLATAACGSWQQVIQAAAVRRDELDATDRAAADALTATMATWNEDELSDYWQSVAGQLNSTNGKSISGFLEVEIVALSQLAGRIGET